MNKVLNVFIIMLLLVLSINNVSAKECNGKGVLPDYYNHETGEYFKMTNVKNFSFRIRYFVKSKLFSLNKRNVRIYVNNERFTYLDDKPAK